MTIITNYHTTDIVLAATLKYHGYELNDIRVDGTKGTFIFNDVPESMIDQYNISQCFVEPQAFNHIIKQLTTSVRRISSLK